MASKQTAFTRNNIRHQGFSTVKQILQLREKPRHTIDITFGLPDASGAAFAYGIDFLPVEFLCVARAFHLCENSGKALLEI